MRAILKVSLLPLAVIALTGCGGISGAWVVDSIEPESVKGSFELGRVVLNEDGTYCARSAYKGETRTSTGKYEFAEDKLTFKSESGKTRVYEAKLAALGKELHVMGGEEGSEWTAVMRHCKCGEKCCKCGNCCGYGKCAPMCAKCGMCAKCCTCQET